LFLAPPHLSHTLCSGLISDLKVGLKGLLS
jgi:hypothetical protein